MRTSSLLILAATVACGSPKPAVPDTGAPTDTEDTSTTEDTVDTVDTVDTAPPGPTSCEVVVHEPRLLGIGDVHVGADGQDVAVGYRTFVGSKDTWEMLDEEAQGEMWLVGAMSEYADTLYGLGAWVAKDGSAWRNLVATFGPDGWTTVHELSLTVEPRDMAVSGDMLAVLGVEDEVCTDCDPRERPVLTVFDGTTWTEHPGLFHERGPLAVAGHPDGGFVVVGYDNLVDWWDAATDTWTAVPVTGVGASDDFNGVDVADDGTIYAVGHAFVHGTVAGVDALQTMDDVIPDPSFYSASGREIVANGPDDLWVSGNVSRSATRHGFVAHKDAAGWTLLYTVPESDAAGLDERDGRVVAGFLDQPEAIVVGGASGLAPAHLEYRLKWTQALAAADGGALAATLDHAIGAYDGSSWRGAPGIMERKENQGFVAVATTDGVTGWLAQGEDAVWYFDGEGVDEEVIPSGEITAVAAEGDVVVAGGVSSVGATVWQRLDGVWTWMVLPPSGDRVSALDVHDGVIRVATSRAGETEIARWDGKVWTVEAVSNEPAAAFAVEPDGALVYTVDDPGQPGLRRVQGGADDAVADAPEGIAAVEVTDDGAIWAVVRAGSGTFDLVRREPVAGAWETMLVGIGEDPSLATDGALVHVADQELIWTVSACAEAP